MKIPIRSFFNIYIIKITDAISDAIIIPKIIFINVNTKMEKLSTTTYFIPLNIIGNVGNIYVFFIIDDNRIHNRTIKIIVDKEKIYLLLIIEFFIRKFSADAIA